MLRKKNSDFTIKNINDESFLKYGEVLDSKYFNESFSYLRNTVVPESGNFYIAHDDKFYSSITNTHVFDDVFGYIDLQYGFVNGNNSKLNALEYHHSLEINVALTPLVLFLGLKDDIDNNNYDASLLETFYVPANTVIKLNPGVLHFSPCKVSDEGFKCGVILPKGTNTEFVNSKYFIGKEDNLLFKTNKWIIGHKENEQLIEKGVYPGIKGTNYEIKY